MCRLRRGRGSKPTHRRREGHEAKGKRAARERRSPQFSRGRLDHFALLAPSEGAFTELRRRIEAEGAADGEVRDMRNFWIMGYFDPDGAATS
jgi:hypothetical protein